MSINITVHGKQLKCVKNNILEDHEKVNREQQNERRKLRLQQVRQESNKIAKKIRKDVEREKNIQLKKIEKIKTQELDNWRRNVVAKTKDDHCSAIFQIGEAHRAAQKENERMAKKKAETRNPKKKCKSVTQTEKKTMEIPVIKVCKGTSAKSTNKTDFGNVQVQTIKNIYVPVDSFSNVQSSSSDSILEVYQNTQFTTDCGDLSIEDVEKTDFSDSDQSETDTSQAASKCSAKPSQTFKKTQLSPQKLKTKLSQKTIIQFHDSELSSEETEDSDSSKSSNIKSCDMILSPVLRSPRRLTISKTTTPKCLINQNKRVGKNCNYLKRSTSLASKTCPSPRRNTSPVSNLSMCKTGSPVTRFTQISDSFKSSNTKKSGVVSSLSPPVKTPRRLTKSSSYTKSCGGVSSPPVRSPRRLTKSSSNTKRCGVVSSPSPSVRSPRRLTKSSSNTKRCGVVSSPSVRSPRRLPISKTAPKRLISQSKKIEKNCNILKKSASSTSKLSSPRKNTSPVSNPSISKPVSPVIFAPRFTQISDLVKRQENTKISSEKLKISPHQSSEKEEIQSNINIVSKSKCAIQKLDSKYSLHSNEGNKVKFYDHFNKFQKEYTSEINVHPDRESEQCKLNANQQAIIENQLREIHNKHTEKLRERAEIRGQQAIEKESIRRDYEALNIKLSALTEQRPTNCSDPHLLSDFQIKQNNISTQTKLCKAVEKIIQQPTIITCPEIDIDSRKTKKGNLGDKLGLNVNIPMNQADSSCSSSSTSCSILLDYIQSQSQLISDDIQKNNYSENKVNKLRNLLQQLNSLRKQLELEIKKLENEGDIDKSQFQNMVDSISDMRKERENILICDTEENLIKHRERQLKKKEAILEKRLKQFYELQREKCKNPKTDKELKTEDICSSSSGVEILNEDCNKPMEIVIKLRQKHKKKNIKDLSPSRIKRRKDNKLYSPKPTIPNKTLIEKVEDDDDDDTTQGTGSTSYKSPPEKLQTALGKVLNEYNNRQSSESYPIGIHKPDEINEKTILSKDDQQISHVKQAQINESLEDLNRRPLNPLVVHYIQKLLGMSRNSIKTLGVSSSDISTPSSSIMNTTGNLCNNDLENLEKVERLQKFIEDNRSFINQMECTIQNESITSAASINSIKPLPENASVKNLKSQKISAPNSFKKPTSILKNNSKSSDSVENAYQLVPNQLKAAHAQQYSELTENCQQRIADLNNMINQVRMEKQKVLEMSFSSSSENCRNSTEYMDFPAPLKTNETNEFTSAEAPNSHNIQRIIENIPRCSNLEKNKPIGISRDSGISSRPTTALEFRESPDVNECPLKNKKKPPSSNVRSSPQLVNEVPRHELSAIAEADSTINSTLANFICSQINVNERNDSQDSSRENKSANVFECVEIAPKQKSPPSTPAVQNQCAAKDINSPKSLSQNNEHNNENARSADVLIDEGSSSKKELSYVSSDKICYNQFPTFEEYAAYNNISLEKIDASCSAQLRTEFDKLIKLSKQGDNIEYQEFPTINTYLHAASFGTSEEIFDELIKSLKVNDLSTKKFQNLREYLQNIDDITSSFDTLSLMSIEQLDKEQNGNESDTFIDINKELIKRNIMSKPFQDINTPNDDNGASKMDLNSPEFGISHNIEKELDQMGLKWANVMLKKAQEAQAQCSSTTESSYCHIPSRKKSPRKYQRTEDNAAHRRNDDKSSSSTTNSLSSKSFLAGQPLNLRDFLTKELQKRTDSSISSNTSNGSFASLFVRSILGCLNSPQNRQINLEVQKTSTPVPSNLSKNHSSSSSSKLFSGESHLSEVQYDNTMDNFTT